MKRKLLLIVGSMVSGTSHLSTSNLTVASFDFQHRGFNSRSGAGINAVTWLRKWLFNRRTFVLFCQEVWLTVLLVWLLPSFTCGYQFHFPLSALVQLVCVTPKWGVKPWNFVSCLSAEKQMSLKDHDLLDTFCKSQ